jgi:hypothetical protein
MRILPLLALPFLASPALAAGPLAPTRASEVVQLFASFNPPGCTASAAGATLDTRVLPDGTYAPLVIPPKRVLVITDVRWIANTLEPNEEIWVFLRPGPPQPGFGSLPLAGARSDANGRAAGQAHLDPGIVVRSLADLCVTLSDSGGPKAPGNLAGSGFFAKDK